MNMKKPDRLLRTLGLAGLFLFVIAMPYSPALSEAGFDAALLAAIIGAAWNKHVHLPPKAYTIALAAFLVLAGITIPFSLDPALSIRKFGIVRWLLFPFVIPNLGIDSKTSKRLLNVLLTISGVFALFLIAQHLLGKTIVPYKFDVYQTVDSANNNLSDRIALRFGQYYAVLFAFVVVFTYFGKGLMHIVRSITSALVSIATTYFAYARSGAAGLWSSFMVFGLLRARPILYGTLMATLLGLSFVFVFPHTELSELFYSTIHPTKASGVRYGSNLARIHMLENTEQILRQHPFTGAGFNCYGEWTKVNRPEDAGWKRTFSDPVEFLATTGAIGFLGFFILYAGIFSVLFTTHDALSNAVLAAFLVFAAGGAFEPMFFNTMLLRGMMFLIALSISDRVRKELTP